MKEYKLSAKSKYSVCYLLCGLFMFFFMFAILSLNSHASAVSDYVLNITSSNGTFFETSGLYHSFSSGLQHPEYAYPITTVSGSSSFTRPTSVESVNLEVHVVTSKGDFVVDTHQGTGSYEAFSSVKLEGYPIGYYGVCKGYLKEGTSSTTMTMNVSCSASVSNQSTNVTNTLSSIQSTTNQILDSLGGGSSSFSDYSTYSPVNSLYAFYTTSEYGNEFYDSNSLFAFSFPDYSGSNLKFTNSSLYFYPVKGGHYILNFDYFGNTDSSSTTNFTVGLYTLHNQGDFLRSFTSSDFTWTKFQNHYFYSLYFDYNYDYSEPAFIIISNATVATNITSPSCNLVVYKATISDYMDYVKHNYDNITPSVTDLNQNTAQSVSDISTAQTFETTAFDNFDTQFSNSGLDTFSMSFASTPLLWVSSIITTFYNNMPSTFQYLLMFVAFVGILCTVLNVFGRVAQRFGGGDNATKLNSKDVFSKIEKNGSI